MRCRKVQPLLGPYAEGKIGEKQATEVKQHLEGCVRCRYELALEEAIVSGMEAYPVLEVPKGFTDEVTERFAERIPAEEPVLENIQDLPRLLGQIVAVNLRWTQDLLRLRLGFACHRVLDVVAYVKDLLHYTQEVVVAALDLAYRASTT